MKVSVVITTYNNPDYLQRVLEGYLNQSRIPDEILVADDGSTQDTFDMIDNMKKLLPAGLLTHVWHEDRGFRAASIRNKAIAASTGEYIILADGDTIPSPQLVEDHLRYSEEGHFIQGHRVLLGPEISKLFRFSYINLMAVGRMLFTREASNIVNGLRLPPIVRISRKCSGTRSCNISFFKKDIIAVNGFNEDFEGWGKEDSELVERFYKYGLKRKDLKFRGCCYHLYHNELDRTRLNANIRLLEKTKAQRSHYCANGLDKYFTRRPDQSK